MCECPLPGAGQVEGDPGDALIVAEVLADRPVRLHTMRDSDEEMAFLARTRDGDEDAPQPGSCWI